MNKCMCASIISLHKLQPCSRNDIHCSVLISCTSPLSCSLICTFTHTNFRYRWLLCFVVMKYELKELQIKMCLDVSVTVCLCFLSFCFSHSSVQFFLTMY